MSSRHLPVIKLCSSPASSHILLAFENQLQVVENSLEGRLLASTTLNKQEEQHKMRVRQVAQSAKHGLFISVGEDKLVKTWKLQSNSTKDVQPLILLSSRPIPKRANTCKLSPDEESIIIGDRFGDVFSLPIDATQEELIQDARQRKPVLGHVSMLTDLAFSNDGAQIITGDRDEHVRISRWPEGYDIIRFLFGHTRCVASLLVLKESQLLLSAGADSCVFVWDLSTFSLIRQIEIGEFLKPFSKLSSTRYEARKAYVQQRGKYKRKKRKGQIGVGLVSENDDAFVPETESSQAMETIDDHPQASTSQLSKEDTNKPVLVTKMIELNDGRVAILAAGNSAIGIINPRQEESVTVTDLRHPILDMCSLAADGAENYLVSLDITLPGDVVSNEGSLITIQRNEQGFVPIQNSSLSAYLCSICSAPVTEEEPYPNSTTLYSELELLFKDPQDYDSLQDPPHEATEDDDKKAKQSNKKPPKNTKKHEGSVNGKGDQEHGRAAKKAKV